MRTDKELSSRSVDQIVTDWLSEVNLAKWKENLPVTGNVEVDKAKLKEAIKKYALMGSHYPIFEPKNSNEECGAMTYWLAAKALDIVADWKKILELWYIMRSPEAKSEIVGADWEYLYDREFIDDTGDPSNMVSVQNPEWIGKPCGDCCHCWEYFRRPEWKV